MEGPEVDIHCVKAKILKLDNVLGMIAEKNDQMEALNVDYSRLKADNFKLMSEKSALFASNSELIACNAELSASNEELQACKKELTAANAGLHDSLTLEQGRVDEILWKYNRLQVDYEQIISESSDKNELAAKNSELLASNSELLAFKSELLDNNNDLLAKNTELHAKNNELNSSSIELKAKNQELIALATINEELLASERQKLEEVQSEYNKMRAAFKKCEEELRMINQASCKNLLEKLQVENEEQSNSGCHKKASEEDVIDVLSPCSIDSEDVSDGEIERILHEMRTPQLIESIRSPIKIQTLNETQNVYSNKTQAGCLKDTQIEQLEETQIETKPERLKETEMPLKETQIECLKETQTLLKETQIERLKDIRIECSKGTQTELQIFCSKETQTEREIHLTKETQTNYLGCAKTTQTLYLGCTKEIQTEVLPKTSKSTQADCSESSSSNLERSKSTDNRLNNKQKVTLRKAIETLKRSKVDVTIKNGRLINYANRKLCSSITSLEKRIEKKILSKVIVYIDKNLNNANVSNSLRNMFMKRDVVANREIEAPPKRSAFDSGYTSDHEFSSKENPAPVLAESDLSNVENHLPNFIKQIMQNAESDRTSLSENEVQISIPDADTSSDLEYYSESTEFDMMDFLNEKFCDALEIPSKQLAVQLQEPAVATEFPINIAQDSEVAIAKNEPQIAQKRTANETALENFNAVNLHSKNESKCVKSNVSNVKSKCKRSIFNESNSQQSEANSDESSSDTIIVYKCLTECTGIPKALTPFSSEISLPALTQEIKQLKNTVLLEKPKLTEEIMDLKDVALHEKSKLTEIQINPLRELQDGLKAKNVSYKAQFLKSLNPLSKAKVSPQINEKAPKRKLTEDESAKLNERALKQKLTEDICDETNIICAGGTIVPDVSCKKVKLENCDSNLSKLDLNGKSEDDTCQLRNDRCISSKGMSCRAEKLEEAVKTPEFLGKIRILEECILRNKPALSWYSTKKMLQCLVRYKAEEVIIKRTVERFDTLDTYNLVDYLIRFVASDTGEPEKTTSPFEPVLTITQKTTLTLLLRLEKTNKPDVTETFLAESERRLLFAERDPLVVERVARVYAAACKMKRYKKRLRKLICDGMYFMGDLVVPLIFYILTTWIQVLKINSGQLDEPLPKVLVQLVYTKTCNLPEYCLSVLRNLLQIYYKYPSDRYNANDLFQEFLEGFICNLEAKYEFALIILCKLNTKSWCEQKLSLIKELITITKDNMVIAALVRLIEKINSEVKEANDKISLINTTKESGS